MVRFFSIHKCFSSSAEADNITDGGLAGITPDDEFWGSDVLSSPRTDPWTDHNTSVTGRGSGANMRPRDFWMCVSCAAVLRGPGQGWG